MVEGKWCARQDPNRSVGNDSPIARNPQLRGGAPCAGRQEGGQSFQRAQRVCSLPRDEPCEPVPGQNLTESPKDGRRLIVLRVEKLPVTYPPRLCENPLKMGTQGAEGMRVVAVGLQRIRDHDELH